jgi:hypothetical protein
MQATTLAGDLEDLRGVREPEMVHRDGLEGADLDPAVGLVARAVQDRNTMPGKLGAALVQGGLVGLDGQQVVRPLGDHEELGGVAVGLRASAVTTVSARFRSASNGWNPGTSPGAPSTWRWATTARVA